MLLPMLRPFGFTHSSLSRQVSEIPLYARSSCAQNGQLPVIHWLHPFHPGLVQGGAQASLFRHREGLCFGHQGAHLATLERHPRLDQVLQHRAERLALRCHAGRSRQHVVPVRNDLHARIPLGQFTNLQPFADPAAPLRIRLHEADDPPIQNGLTFQRVYQCSAAASIIPVSPFSRVSPSGSSGHNGCSGQCGWQGRIPLASAIA